MLSRAMTRAEAVFRASQSAEDPMEAQVLEPDPQPLGSPSVA
jgi:hypothetical protein